MKRTVSFLVIILFTFLLFAAKPKPAYLEWAVKVADGELKRQPALGLSTAENQLKWDDLHGLLSSSCLKLFYATGDTAYYRYVKAMAEYFIESNGTIKSYEPNEYNIASLNGGNFLFDMFTITQDTKYISAIRDLRTQLYTQPRVSERAFWHSKKTSHQLWLDDLYFGAPFYTHFAAIFDQPMAVFDDVIMQFRTVVKYTKDDKTGLNYHGWDESYAEAWANRTTGHSESFWSCGIGWYMMAIVDVLEYLPFNHPDRLYLMKVLNRIASGLLKFQDKKTGMWWQVTNFPRKKGNFLESSGTAMFSYAMAKAVNNGYLPRKKFQKSAEKAFLGILKHSMIENADSTFSITQSSPDVVLGGYPYKDGKFYSYVGEPVRNDDYKAIGPFIQAAIELSKMK